MVISNMQIFVKKTKPICKFLEGFLTFSFFTKEASAGDGYHQHIARAPYIDAADSGDLEELLLKHGVPSATPFDGFPPMSESKDIPSGAMGDHAADLVAALQDVDGVKEEDISSGSEELTGFKKVTKNVQWF